MNLLLFGAPGAGKGTQSALLVSKLGMKHISTGDLFRRAIREQTPLGLEAKKYTDRGDLVPDAVVIGMVEEELLGLEGKPFVLDGFPRTVAQAEALANLAKQYSVDLGLAVFLEVPEAYLVSRLSGRRTCKNCGAVYHVESRPTKKDGVCDSCGGEVVQRADDTEAAIRHRLGVYLKSTHPLKEFYRSQRKLVEVDGTGTTEEVFSRLTKVLA